MNAIELAVKYLNDGEVVAIPTETVYGLAGNALNVDAVAKIFQIKNRPVFDPLIVHTHDVERIKEYVSHMSDKARALAEAFWPGPLTLLLPKKDIIPDLVTAGLPNVAIRIPQHTLTLELLSMLDFPLAAPSANPFGYISPTTASHVRKQLGYRIPYILDGGACQVGIESTIIGFEGDQAIIYRLGGLSLEMIEGKIGKVDMVLHSSSNPQASGMLESHYAPKKKMQLVNFQRFDLNALMDETKLAKEEIGVLRFNTYFQTLPQEKQRILSLESDFAEAAKNLFAFMRELDQMDIKLILAELIPEMDLGRAINDRLRRAAH